MSKKKKKKNGAEPEAAKPKPAPAETLVEVSKPTSKGMLELWLISALAIVGSAFWFLAPKASEVKELPNKPTANSGAKDKTQATVNEDTTIDSLLNQLIKMGYKKFFVADLAHQEDDARDYFTNTLAPAFQKLLPDQKITMPYEIPKLHGENLFQQLSKATTKEQKMLLLKQFFAPLIIYQMRQSQGTSGEFLESRFNFLEKPKQLGFKLAPIDGEIMANNTSAKLRLSEAITKLNDIVNAHKGQPTDVVMALPEYKKALAEYMAAGKERIKESTPIWVANIKAAAGEDGFTLGFLGAQHLSDEEGIQHKFKCVTIKPAVLVDKISDPQIKREPNNEFDFVIWLPDPKAKAKLDLANLRIQALSTRTDINGTLGLVNECHNNLYFYFQNNNPSQLNAFIQTKTGPVINSIIQWNTTGNEPADFRSKLLNLKNATDAIPLEARQSNASVIAAENAISALLQRFKLIPSLPAPSAGGPGRQSF